MYLHLIFKNGRIDGGRIEYVKLFSVIALFIFSDRLRKFHEPDDRTFYEEGEGNRS
jgi:hypothetical protein